MEVFKELLKSWVVMAFGGTITLASVISVTASIVQSIKNGKLTKINAELISIIKNKQDQEDLVMAELNSIKQGIKYQSNIVTASFLDSNIGINTKKYISEQASELGKAVPEINNAIEVVKDRVDEVIEKVKETKEVIESKVKETVDSAKKIGHDSLQLYNQIMKNTKGE